MSRARSITFLITALLLVPATAAISGDGELPDQMIYGGLEGDPVSDPRPAPVRLVASWMRFPDHRDAQVYRLSWWAKIGEAHAVQLSLDYVGIQSEESFRYGGGQPDVRWTTRIFPLRDFSLALDLAAGTPLGDETLFPLSARAPTGMVRVRASIIRAGFSRFWVGWWGRQVSPPSDENRQDPLSGFASGTGFDALMEWRLSRVDVDWMLHLPTGGQVNRVFHWTVDADVYFSEDLALRIGFALDTGPRTDRSFDWTARMGATWRPSGREKEE